MQKKKWILPVILGSVGLILLLAGAGVIFYITSVVIPKKQIQIHFNEADALASAGNYTNAIKAIDDAIAIDPTNEEAYLRLGDIYEEFAGQYVQDGKPDETRDTLTGGVDALLKGYNSTGSVDVKARLDNLQNKIDDFVEQAEKRKVEIEKEQLLQSLLPMIETIADGIWEGNWDKVFNYMQGAEYEKFLKERIKLEDKTVFTTKRGDIVYCRTNDKDHGNYMFYFGSLNDAGEREGEADWFGFFDGNNYQGHGFWSNDMPNGQWEVKEWNSGLNKNVVYRYLDGNVIDGLWDGKVGWNFDFIQTSGIRSRHVVFDHGKWVVKGDRDKNGYYQSTTGQDDGIFLYDSDLDDLRGIAGYETIT